MPQKWRRITMLLTNAFMPDPRPYAEAMALKSAGYEVKFLCWDRGEGLPKNDEVGAIKVERIGLSSTHGRGTSQAMFLGVLWIKMLFRLLKDDQDIIYCHDFDTLPVGLIIKVLKRKKIVFDSHDIFSKVLGSNIGAAMKRFIEILERSFIKHADLTIVASEDVGVFYERFGVKNITVVGNYKDPAVFRIPSEILDKERLSLGIGNRLVISYISNLGPERIIEPLLDVVKEDNGIVLLIGGQGYQQTAVERAAAECSRIKYLGYVRVDKMPLYTAMSDVVYYGYDKSAGMAEYLNPNKLFEALASGKAFIGCDFGEMGRIIKETNCGVALEDFTKENVKKAVDIMKDGNKIRAFQDNALRAGMQKYNWHASESNLLAAISGLG